MSVKMLNDVGDEGHLDRELFENAKRDVVPFNPSQVSSFEIVKVGPQNVHSQKTSRVR